MHNIFKLCRRLSSCQGKAFGLGLVQDARASCKRKVEKRGVPRFLPEARIRPSDSAIPKSSSSSFFPPQPSALTCLFIGQSPCANLGLAIPETHHACHSPSARHGRSLIEGDYLAIAKCRTLQQHLPLCCPPPPIRAPAALIKT